MMGITECIMIHTPEKILTLYILTYFCVLSIESDKTDKGLKVQTQTVDKMLSLS